MSETLGQTVDRILERAAIELAKAIEKFPQPNYVGLKVAEEAGEVIKASVHYAEGRETWDKVEGEVVQMIAMGLRLLVEGDQKNGIIPPHPIIPIKKTDPVIGTVPAANAIDEIAAERRRQIAVEGWAPEHDDGHDDGKLAIAAACYAYASTGGAIIRAWPFAEHWWKPDCGRRDLIKAGALIVAEIERLDRLAARTANNE